MLFTAKPDGRLAFPLLEDVTLWGFDSGKPHIYANENLRTTLRAEDRISILKTAVTRLYTPQVMSIKRMRIDPRIIDDWEVLEDLRETDFAEELESYVPAIAWKKVMMHG